jgi:hypothetical protein
MQNNSGTSYREYSFDFADMPVAVGVEILDNKNIRVVISLAVEKGGALITGKDLGATLFDEDNKRFVTTMLPESGILRSIIKGNTEVQFATFIFSSKVRRSPRWLLITLLNQDFRLDLEDNCYRSEIEFEKLPPTFPTELPSEAAGHTLCPRPSEARQH